MDLGDGPRPIRREGLSFATHIEPHDTWTVDLHVTTAHDVAGSGAQQPKYERGAKARPNMELSLEKWLDNAPRLECDWDPLKAIYQRSLVDLAALRFSPVSLPGHYLRPPACPGS